MYKYYLNLTYGSHERVGVLCDLCNFEYIQEYRESVKSFKRHNKHLCKQCLCKNASDRMKNNNPMKKIDVKRKMSDSRKRKFKEDLGFARQHAESTKKSWADGKHANTNVGRCKWYDYTKKDGTIIKCQGTWELAFVKWADINDVKFEAHKGRIEYVDNNGDKRNYYPDFYVYGWKSYVDTKSEYFQKLSEDKIRCVLKSNPNLPLKILGRRELAALGVVIPGVLSKKNK